MRWFTRWIDALDERQEFQFGELMSFNPEYDCLYLRVPLLRDGQRTREDRHRNRARVPSRRT
jgi:hypothetical protein